MTVPKPYLLQVKYPNGSYGHFAYKDEALREKAIRKLVGEVESIECLDQESLFPDENSAQTAARNPQNEIPY